MRREDGHVRVGLVGYGVIDVTSAYELAADGHEVTGFQQVAAA